MHKKWHLFPMPHSYYDDETFITYFGFVKVHKVEQNVRMHETIINITWQQDCYNLFLQQINIETFRVFLQFIYNSINLLDGSFIWHFNFQQVQLYRKCGKIISFIEIKPTLSNCQSDPLGISKFASHKEIF